MTTQELMNYEAQLNTGVNLATKGIDDFLTEQSIIRNTQANLLKEVDKQNNLILRVNKELEDSKAAMTLLNSVNDANTAQNYAFIEHNLNIALDKVFNNSVRKIQLVEGTYHSKYPELRLELTTENGIKRSLKTDSGHGMRQIVSLLCTLCLICVSGARRFLVLDEVLTGLSSESREAVDDILWAFTSIGFQFVIVEHGFIAKGSNVYKLELNNGISRCVDNYVDENGFYMAYEDEHEKEDDLQLSSPSGPISYTL